MDQPARTVEARLVNCGDPGSVRGVCWNGSPYQPVPVASDVSKKVALRILEQPEDYPGVVAEQQSVRSYPEPYGINAAHLLGYLSPITEDELDRRREGDDRSLNGASVVGRAGVEKEYDAWLRGMPGYRRVAVDSMGRVLGDDGEVDSTPGDTLVTSIDARVQARRRAAAGPDDQDRAARRRTRSPGATTWPTPVPRSCMEAKTGRIVAMASQPTYDPERVGRGHQRAKQLARLYSEKAGTPLLSRATQGQFAPGSTWKPFMTAGALTHGYRPDTQLNCSSGFQVGNRAFKNYESGAYGYIGFAKALEVSCNTFFYRVGYDYWRRLGSDVDRRQREGPAGRARRRVRLRLRDRHRPARRGHGPDRGPALEAGLLRGAEGLLLQASRKPRPRPVRLRYPLRPRVLRRGLRLPRRRRGQLLDRPGRHDRHPAPAGARATPRSPTAARSTSPAIGKAIVDADGDGDEADHAEGAGRGRRAEANVLDYIDSALQGVTREGTMAWRMIGFPLDEVTIRSKTGSAEVYGKQSTSWVASYTKDYVVVMMVTQGGTGSGTSGPASARSGRRSTASTARPYGPPRPRSPASWPPDGLPDVPPTTGRSCRRQRPTVREAGS